MTKPDSSYAALSATFIIKQALMLRIILSLTLLAATISLAAQPLAHPGDDLRQLQWAETAPIINSADMDETFAAYPVEGVVAERIKGKSFAKGCTIPMEELRYLILPHFDGKGHVKIGEMICHESIAADLIDIFRQLFNLRYPIESMRLIDDFDANDVRSMEANNSSAFCYRVVAGSKKLSAHARGVAVDINPLYNPYVKQKPDRLIVSPEAARPYADRSRTDIPMKIDADDPATLLFKAHGFEWGGDWTTLKDYQHFEKD